MYIRIQVYESNSNITNTCIEVLTAYRFVIGLLRAIQIEKHIERVMEWLHVFFMPQLIS